jgi:hypothetical protein
LSVQSRHQDQLSLELEAVLGGGECPYQQIGTCPIFILASAEYANSGFLDGA